VRTKDNSPLGVALGSGLADALRHGRPVVRAVRRDANAREAQRLELLGIEVKLMERERKGNKGELEGHGSCSKASYFLNCDSDGWSSGWSNGKNAHE